MSLESQNEESDSSILIGKQYSIVCGIVATIGDTDDRLRSLLEATNHRGPDQQGRWSESEVRFGQNRLAIIDPSAVGKQPMQTEDERYVINYNGEVYNFLKLRKELKQNGVRFKSDTDTEVVLKYLSYHGIESIEDLNGIFAFVLYDTHDRTIYLCRDRMGIKPLYYFHPDESSMVISSELRSILSTYDDHPFTQDGKSIHEYYGSRSIRSESLINEITAVKPGEYVSVDIESCESKSESYFTLPDTVDGEKIQKNRQTSEKELVDQLDHLLNEVIKSQLVSDAPIATICSGGVDSSLVTAIASQYRPDIEVYHVAVDHPELNEREYAEQVVNELDLEMYVQELSEEVFVENLEDAVQKNDIPLTHPNSVGVYCINKLAKENGIKVLLTGEGADEIFGGYDNYQLIYNMMRANKAPKQELLSRLDLPSGPPSLAFLDDPESIIELGLRDQLNPSRHQSELTGDWWSLFDEIYDQLEGYESGTAQLAHSFTIADIRRYLIPLLRRADRMSMSHSIEARVPMLDNRILNFALSIPFEHKIKDGEGKYLLKKVAERYLPDEIVYRSKEGFPVAVREWLPEHGYDTTRGYKDVFYYIWADKYL